MSTIAETPVQGNFVWNVTPDEYHRCYDRWSKSMIDIYLDRPRRAEGIFVSRTIPNDFETAATRLGSMKHIAVLEPDRWDECVEIIPAEVLAKNGAKSTNEYKLWAAERPGKILAKSGELDTVRRMVDALHAHPIAGPLMREAGASEQALAWTDDTTGLRMKCLRDRVIRNATWNIDLKTCLDPSPRAFSKAVWEYGYHRQEFIYRLGNAAVFNEDLEEFRFIAVGKEQPHPVAIYKLGPSWMELAREQVLPAIADIAERLETGDWRAAYEKQTLEIDPPHFALYPDRYQLEN